MSVYVDDFFTVATVNNGSRSLRAKWCHMMADNDSELIEFAKKLGMNPAWIQYPGTWKAHFDLTLNRRAKAVRMGAVEIGWREAALMRRGKREPKASQSSRRVTHARA